MTKRETWEAIKKADPEAAKFIIELAAVFGPLGHVEIIVPRETKGDKR